jgi:hypothetical protein
VVFGISLLGLLQPTEANGGPSLSHHDLLAASHDEGVLEAILGPPLIGAGLPAYLIPLEPMAFGSYTRSPVSSTIARAAAIVELKCARSL